jgi:hypothetical protein
MSMLVFQDAPPIRLLRIYPPPPPHPRETCHVTLFPWDVSSLFACIISPRLPAVLNQILSKGDSVCVCACAGGGGGANHVSSFRGRMRCPCAQGPISLSVRLAALQPQVIIVTLDRTLLAARRLVTAPRWPAQPVAGPDCDQWV